MTAGGTGVGTSNSRDEAKEPAAPSEKAAASLYSPDAAHIGAGTPVQIKAYVAIWQGFFGSLMIFVGSIGAGWIANGSPMFRHPLVIALRTEGWGVTTSTILLTAGAMLLVRSWLRLGQRLKDWGPGSLRSVVVAVAAWAAPLMFAVPIYSRDVYAYTGQGRLVLEGQNPYTAGISSLSNWFSLGADPAWAEARRRTGPISCGLPGGLWASPTPSPIFPCCSSGCLRRWECCSAWCMFPGSPNCTGSIPAAHCGSPSPTPSFSISFVASAHNDALMVGLAVAGMYFAATGRHITGLLLVTASIGIKPITVLLLPFIGLMWAGPAASWARKFLFWGATAGISFAVLAVSGIPYNLGFGWVWAILDPTPGYTGYSPSGFLGQQVEVIANLLGLPGSTVATGLRTLMKWAGIGLVVVLMFRGDYSRLVRRAALAFAAVVMLSPIIQPWYILWFIPLLAVTGIRDDWQIKSLYVAVTFFVAFGAQDQISVLSFVELNVKVSSLAFLVAVGFTVYLMVLDVHTRRLLIRSSPAQLLRRLEQRLRRSG